MLLVRHPATRSAERRYVLGVVLGEFLGLEWRSGPPVEGRVQISLAGQEDGPSLTIADELLGTPDEMWLTASTLPRRPLAHWQLDTDRLPATLVSPRLPVLYGAEHPAGGFLLESDRGAEFGIDLFGGIFFQLTRYEELVRADRDEHDRFPASASLASQEQFLDRPLVDEYVEVLRALIERLWPRLSTRRREFALRLSHDVDWPAHPATSPLRLARAVAGDIARRRDPGLGVARARALGARRRAAPSEDPYNTFDIIMDGSERRGLRSAFYFMAGRTDPRYDGVYSLEAPWIQALIGRIHRRGHEVGLHPSYGTYLDPAAIAREREVLARTCDALGIEQQQWGGRQHFLRWRNPATWRGWAQAGLSYDSTLGYGREPGFRCGTCFEYPVFDVPAGRALTLRERPLVAMDMAVTEAPAGERLAALERVRTLARRCRMFGGAFTLLWHNSQLVSRRQRALYEEAIGSAR